MSAIKRNNVIIMGEGKDIMLFAHGFGCDQNAWKHIRDAFAKDRKLVLFDYVGAGKSDLSEYDPEKYNSLDGYATDVIEICEELKLQDVIFVGHSVSCMIGALASIRKPHLFKKLIFIGPSPCYINKENYTGGFYKDVIDTLFEIMEEDYIGWARSFAPTVMGKEKGEGKVNELSESFCSIDPVIARQFAKVTFLADNRKDLPLIPVESLTIQCSVDNIASLSVGQYVNQHTPNNTLKVLQAYTHCPHMSYPEETIAAISAFL